MASPQNFELVQRKAKAYATSDIVPIQFRNMANCVVALEMAQRMDMNPLMLMQNSYIIHGKLGWSSTFIIARINSCGRFTPLQFKFSGKGDTRACVAHAKDKQSGQLLESIEVNMAMAKAEGWLGKPGSKWKTMPDLMLQYRAAAFFGRAYAADMLLGMHSTDEIMDSMGEQTFMPKSNKVPMSAEMILQTEDDETEIAEIIGESSDA